MKEKIPAIDWIKAERVNLTALFRNGSCKYGDKKGIFKTNPKTI